MPGMKHPAHILPGIAYLDHKPYMYDLVCFWCIMHGSNIMPDDDTSHLLVLFLFLWRLRGGLEPAAISRFLMKFFHMIEYLQVSMSIMSKWTGRNLMILQKMISRFWWYSQVLCLNYECAHKLRHSLLGNTDIDIGINLVELYNTERPKLGSTVCVQWILPHGLYDDVPVYREGRRSVLPFQWYKHGWIVRSAAICQTKDCLFETAFSIQKLAPLTGLHIVVYSNGLLRFHFLVSAAYLH